MEINERVAVVTGAATGTGRAIARRLAAEGAAVIVADIDPAGGDETRRMIAADGGRAQFVWADLRHEPDTARLIDAAVTSFRPPRHSDQQRRWVRAPRAAPWRCRPLRSRPVPASSVAAPNETNDVVSRTWLIHPEDLGDGSPVGYRAGGAPTVGPPLRR